MRIRALRKQFGSDVVALDNVSLAIGRGELTCLLGNNGAGKTTLVSCLTGLLPPSAGDATIDGLSIRTSMDAIRARLLGVCSQLDTLFPSLTAAHHLALYASLRAGGGGRGGARISGGGVGEVGAEVGAEAAEVLLERLGLSERWRRAIEPGDGVVTGA